MSKERKNILITKMSSLGDVVLSTPVAQLLKELESHSFIGWVVEASNSGVLEDNPFIDELFIWDKTFKGFTKVLKEIRRYKWDVCLDLQGLFKTAIFCLLSGAKTRIGHMKIERSSSIFYTHLVPNNPSFHAVEAYLFTTYSLNSYLSAGNFRQALKEGMKEIRNTAKRLKPAIYLSERERAKAKDILGDNSSFVVLCPGTTWPSKRWLSQRWAMVGDSLIREGYKVVFLGAKADRPLVEEIKKFMRGPCLDLTGKTTIREAAGILENAKLVISVDSGAMHLATAVNTPVLALFGPTAPQIQGPYGKEHKVIYKKSSCSPCRERHCSRKICMELIGEEEVLKVAEEMIERGKGETF